MMLTGLLLFVLLEITNGQQCGSPSVSTGHVIGGINAPHGAFPWQINLLEHGSTICGGSILTPTWILTAAHCVLNQRTQQVKSSSILKVRVGDNNRRHLDPEEKTYNVKKIIAHPNFKFYSMISDVALIELPAPVLFNNYVKPICLPSTAGKVGEQCVISGWGRTNRYHGSLSYQLKYAKMPVIDSNRCANAMFAVAFFPITRHSLCAGYGNTRVSGCQGDSGGPFVCKRNGHWELHGVVSWGSNKCSEKINQYSVFANVFNLKSWIQKHISSL